jgi:PAS domain S-box-containing protein
MPTNASLSLDLEPVVGGSRDRIFVTGEMADRIRAYPWQTTSLGPIADWPDVRAWSVNTMLECCFPCAILWGTAMAQLYNDNYIPLAADRHPSLLGKSAPEEWAEAWHIVGPDIESVLERRVSLHQENILIPCLRNGALEDVYWTYSYSPIRDTGGAVAGVLVMCRDVTAKTALERERDAVATNLQSVLDSITDGLAVLDRDWRYTYFNQQGAAMLGMRSEDLVGQRLGGVVPEVSGSVFDRQYRRAVETGVPVHFEDYFPAPLNRWIECHAYPTKDGLSVYFRDVTERKRTEQALRASEARFRKLFDSNMMGICVPDRFGAFRESNDELLRMTGYTRKDLEAGLVRWDAMTPPEYRNLDALHILEAAERGSCTPYEKEYIRKDGTRVPILCGYALLEGSQDEYIGFVLDLTPQKQTEAALREREERFRVLAETLPQLIWMSDANGITTYCNRRVAEYFGIDPSELATASWRPRLHPEDVERVFATWWRSIQQQEPFQVEYRLRRHDGQYRSFLVRALPVRNEAGEVERWIGSSTDVHDQKIAEEGLRRTEKLATAGRLAASIAHEINNPLASVTNALYLALQDASIPAETRGYLSVCEQELARVAQITTQTLRFHRQSKAAANADLGEVMESVLSLFKHRLVDRQVEVARQCESGARIECFADEVRQVFANLVGNALDATQPGGRILIRIANTRDWDAQRTPGARVIVADTGQGIAADIKTRLFEPFVSTKEATGVGLGLWVSEGIIRKHKGWIRIRSNATAERHGTVISLFFPRSGVAG